MENNLNLKLIDIIENLELVFAEIRQAKLANEGAHSALELTLEDTTLRPIIERAIVEANDFSCLSNYALKASEDELETILSSLRKLSE